MVLLLYFMFEKFTKRFSSKATEGAIDGVKAVFNDHIDEYGDIIKVLLVFGVTIFGVKHLTKKSTPSFSDYSSYISPYRLPAGNGQPIVINNYYRQENKEVNPNYGKQQTGARQGKARPNHQKY